MVWWLGKTTHIRQNLKVKMQNQNVKFKNDLKKRSVGLVLRIIKLIDYLAKELVVGVICKQLIRSATSIGANVVEARGASSKKDFTNFFCYALKSANETVYWLELLRDSGKANNVDLSSLLQEANEIANMLGSSVLTLKGKR